MEGVEQGFLVIFHRCDLVLLIADIDLELFLHYGHLPFKFAAQGVRNGILLIVHLREYHFSVNDGVVASFALHLKIRRGSSDRHRRR